MAMSPRTKSRWAQGFFPGPMVAQEAASCSPLVAGGLIVDVVGDVLNVIWGQLVTEGGHLAVAVGDLGDDLVNSELVVGDQCVLLQLLLWHDGVVATCVAGSAVAGEDGLAILEVCCLRWPSSCNSCNHAQGCAECQGAPGKGIGLHTCLLKASCCSVRGAACSSALAHGGQEALCAEEHTAGKRHNRCQALHVVASESAILRTSKVELSTPSSS
mmetsp:Transcript_40950/g.96180  ORF Transcript_40950/g.96180 Transcript_40950/m.96180 type:complete len:215 (-) Transcript_40950:8-652(-)